jgi:membrane-bound lytic murein transglycosylase B
MDLRPVLTLVTLGLVLVAAPARALDIDAYPELRLFMDEMTAKYDFPAADLQRWFADAQLRPAIVEAMERPKEALPWHKYRPLFVTEDNARKAARYWRKNAPALARAHEHYGVEPEIVLAILSVETRLGKNTGGYRVLDALTTLAFTYPARGEFFRRELEEYLLLARDLGVDPREIKGSYAGAMGIPQFIPSSYRVFAIDFDGDAKRDIVHSVDDAIGSVAHYFKRHGWRGGEPVTDAARVEGEYYLRIADAGVRPRADLKSLRKYGIAAPDGADEGRQASLFALQEEDGAVYRLGYHNFYVITRYNRSRHYAMAVHELSQLIRRFHDLGGDS